jgi:TIR domain
MLFISHATPEDNQFAMWLALRLAAEGYPVWCDLTKLIGGEPFWREIESAVRERSCRFLFVLSKHSNANEGTRDELELAATVRKQLEDDHFIIPLRVDAFSCSNTNIRIHQLNVVDFVPNWMTGFQRLLERLQDDKVQKDERFGIDAVSVWWRQQFGEDEGISETEDIYLTNRLELTSIPSSINLIGLESEPSRDLNPDDAPFPLAAHKRMLVSFADARDLLPFLERNKLHFDEGSQRLDSETFLDRGLYPALESRMAKNLVRYLLRQGFDRFATSKGLKQYSLSNKRKLHWFPQGLVDGDKITFGLPSGGSSWKAVVGYKTIKAKEGTTRIRNWHFGIEAVPRIGFDRFISVLPHVVFSENGQLYESSRRQHSSRRRQCKSWYNNDWRDRILATLWHLSGGKDTISMQLGSEAFASFFAYPEEVSSPVSYARTLRTVIGTPENEDFENEQFEEEDPETVADE